MTNRFMLGERCLEASAIEIWSSLNSSTGMSPPPGITRALTLPNFELVSEETACNFKVIHVYV